MAEIERVERIAMVRERYDRWLDAYIGTSVEASARREYKKKMKEHIADAAEFKETMTKMALNLSTPPMASSSVDVHGAAMFT